MNEEESASSHLHNLDNSADPLGFADSLYKAGSSTCTAVKSPLELFNEFAELIYQAADDDMKKRPNPFDDLATGTYPDIIFSMVGQTGTNVLDDFVRRAYQVNESTDAISEGPSALLDEGTTHTSQRVNSSHSKESSQSEIMIQKKNTCNWTMKFAELQLYRNFYGHCQVRPDHPTLGAWVIRQRSSYKLVQKGKRAPLTQERVSLLNSIGFDWNIPGYHTNSLHSNCKPLPQSEITKEKDHNWYTKFIQLQLYRNFMEIFKFDRITQFWGAG
uniref:Helicase-associated domain-containing protein n=1 Tax=Leptocylindrus danicus TaxID=163516 RepID=A0A7S2PHQ1_9STRA